MSLFKKKKIELPNLPEEPNKENIGDKDMAIISSKIDTITAKVEAIDERIKRIEMILQSWQQQGQSYQQL